MTPKNRRETVGKSSFEKVSSFQKRVAVAYFTQTVVGEISAALIRKHKKFGWTQADLARHLDLDPTQISRWLTGRQSNLTLESVALLSRGLNCEPTFKLVDIDDDLPEVAKERIRWKPVNWKAAVEKEAQSTKLKKVSPRAFDELLDA